MTVKPSNQTHRELPPEFFMDEGDQNIREFKDAEKISSRVVDRSFHRKLKRFTELESEQESGGSSEEIDSPRSVWKNDSRRRIFPVVHQQVLKIKEEDSHLGEDIGEGVSTKEKINLLNLKSQVGAFIFAKQVLPSSPLSGKNAIRSCH